MPGPLRLPKLRSRPSDFRLNPESPLYRGLVFAGLGRKPGTASYQDSSQQRNHGVLTGYTGAGNLPANKWTYDKTLRRAVLGFDGVGDYLQFPDSGIWDATGQYLYVSLFLKWNSTQTSMFACSGGNYQNQVNWMLSKNMTANSIQVGSGDGFGANVAVSCSDGEWVHIATTYPGSSTTWPVYVDGTFAGNSGKAPWWMGAGKGLRFGYAWPGYTGGYFDTAIADILIGKRTLTPSEISALADPDNVMLRCGGVDLIQGVQTLWPGLGAGASVARFPWQQRRSRRMAGHR